MLHRSHRSSMPAAPVAANRGAPWRLADRGHPRWDAALPSWPPCLEHLGLRGDGFGPTIETERGRPVTVEWRNEL